MFFKRKDSGNTGKSNSTGFNDRTATLLRTASAQDKSGLFKLLESDESGLDAETVERKLEKLGSNEVVHDKAPAWYVQLLLAFVDPFIGVLILIAIVSLITDVILAPDPAQRDYKTVMVVATLIILSSLLRFWQEFRSNNAAEKLKSLVKTTATVLRRDSGKVELDIKELVPGDIISLSAGDMMPADCRIIQSKDLFVSQSILTGEALPVEKSE